MENNLPLNTFIRSRREELGMATFADFARGSTLDAHLLSEVEKRTEAPTKVYGHVYRSIAKCIKVNEDAMVACAKTWVADLDALKPEFILPPSSSNVAEEVALIVSIQRFLPNRRTQLGFKTQTQLAKASKRHPPEINGSETGRISSYQMSQPLLKALADTLKLDYNEFAQAAKLGSVNTEKVCLDPPYEEPLGAIGEEEEESSEVSLSIMEALVEAKMPNTKLMESFAQVEQLLGHKLSKGTWLSIIRDIHTNGK